MLRIEYCSREQGPSRPVGHYQMNLRPVFCSPNALYVMFDADASKVAVSSPSMIGVFVSRDGMRTEPSFWKLKVIIAFWKTRLFAGKMSLFSLFSHGREKMNLMSLKSGSLYYSVFGRVITNCFALSSHCVKSLGFPN